MEVGERLIQSVGSVRAEGEHWDGGVGAVGNRGGSASFAARVREWRGCLVGLCWWQTGPLVMITSGCSRCLAGPFSRVAELTCVFHTRRMCVFSTV